MWPRRSRYQGNAPYRSGSLPISNAWMYWRPIPASSARPSAAAIAGRPAARLMPRISFAAEVGGERVRDAQPAVGQAVVDAAGRHHAPDRPPGPVGAVTADPDHRRLARGKPLEQRDQHRVDRERVTSRVLVTAPGIRTRPRRSQAPSPAPSACPKRSRRADRPLGPVALPGRPLDQTTRPRAPPRWRLLRSGEALRAHLGIPLRLSEPHAGANS